MQPILQFKVTSLAILFLGVAVTGIGQTTKADAQAAKETPLQKMMTFPAMGSQPFRGLSNACASILSGNIYDTNRYLSYSYHSKKFYSWACNSNFQTSREMKSSGFSLGIPIEDINIGIDLSDDSTKFQQTLRKWCSTNSAELFDEDFEEKYANTINQGMVQAFGKCIDAEKEKALNQYGVFATAVPENRNLNSFLVTVRFRPVVTTGKKNRITGIEGSVQCLLKNKPIPIPYETSSNEMVMTCKKPSGVGAYLSVSTEDTNSSQPIELPSVDQDAIDQLAQQLANLKFRLRMQIAKTREDINLLSKRHQNWRPKPSEEFHSGYPACDAGYKPLYEYCEGDCSGDDSKIRMCVPDETLREIPVAVPKQ